MIHVEPSHILESRSLRLPSHTKSLQVCGARAASLCHYLGNRVAQNSCLPAGDEMLLQAVTMGSVPQTLNAPTRGILSTHPHPKPSCYRKLSTRHLLHSLPGLVTGLVEGRQIFRSGMELWVWVKAGEIKGCHGGLVFSCPAFFFFFCL